MFPNFITHKSSKIQAMALKHRQLYMNSEVKNRKQERYKKFPLKLFIIFPETKTIVREC
jgi:hypothetical protein